MAKAPYADVRADEERRDLIDSAGESGGAENSRDRITQRGTKVNYNNTCWKYKL